VQSGIYPDNLDAGVGGQALLHFIVKYFAGDDDPGLAPHKPPFLTPVGLPPTGPNLKTLHGQLGF
jgi:hypothetical protein